MLGVIGVDLPRPPENMGLAFADEDSEFSVIGMDLPRPSHPKYLPYRPNTTQLTPTLRGGSANREPQ